MIGYVTNIQKFCVNDGPGIRTTVFLKGCPLNCLWCHNPETKSFQREILYNASQCIGCRSCQDVCPHHCHCFDKNHLYQRDACVVCGLCTDICFSQALTVSGQCLSVEDTMSEVMKDKIFYDNSGGGITLSGGEPLAQFSFSYALLKEAKHRGLHTCVETCGYLPEEHLRAVAPFVDIFLYDYKETDRVLHKAYTGVANETILNNLRLLDSLGNRIILRCPIIPTLNDREEHLLGIAETANSLSHVIGIHVEPYHPLGSGKSRMLGRSYALEHLDFPPEEMVESWIDRIAKETRIPVTRA